MNNLEINQQLSIGNIDTIGVLPHLDNLKSVKYIFTADFGLPFLPVEPGVILIRGPRQYGKSTWLEQQIYATIKEFGHGTALYLNGDEIANSAELITAIRTLAQLFSSHAIKRLFIDEITAIDNWQKALKRLLDAGELTDILLITTGSKASDLRRGMERLPGRKGKLSRTNYIFTPLSYREFKAKCAPVFNTNLLFAYILSGGSPIAANALATTGQLPEYITTIINDWVLGEFAASGRSRASLLAILQSLYRMAGTPIGQAKLARESGLANNTVAHNYMELLSDLMIIAPSFQYDLSKNISIFRKPCKYHFTNLLAAICWHPDKPRTIAELQALGPKLGVIYEWAVAQEIWRRMSIANAELLPEQMNFWQSQQHEIDFVVPEKNLLLEVKAGKTTAIEFSWFLKSFNHEQLTIISKNAFVTDRISGITLEDFYLSADW